MWICVCMCRARCDYIASLPEPKPRCWTCGETWLLGDQLPPFTAIKNLHTTGVDHYKTRYPKAAWPTSFKL